MGAEPTKETGPSIIKLPAEREGESEIYRRPFAKDKLISRYEDNISTLYESFTAAANKYPNNACMGWRVEEGPYQWISYKVVQDRTKNVGSGLVNLGLKPHVDKVGIYSINRPEWMIAEHGCNAYTFCLVPLYDTLGADVCAFIVNQAEIKVVFCAPDKIKLLLNAADQMKTLTHVVQFGTVTEETRTLASAKNVKLLSLEELENLGKEKPVPVDPPKPDEYSTICYTSGTTGLPKGVILTHANVIADISGAFHNGVLPTPNDVHISYLPLAHVFERLVANAVIYFGGAIGFYRGDVRKLFDDIQVLKPTLFPSVPRLWNRLYDKVLGKVNENGGIGKTLFDTAFEAKREGLASGYLTHSVWDAMVFSKVQGQLGGRVRMMITGSAPLSDKVMDFLRICFSCPVIEGYGQTESTAACTTTLPSETKSGHVGVPLGSVEIKLVDVPEMDYLTKDNPPRGEVCFRGPCASPGYYNDKQKTDELIDKNGWSHSGDIGTFLPNGTLKIIDRKKNIFKLSQGEYVAPEKLENVFVQSKWVMQCFIYGDSLKSSVVGIVVPDPDAMKEWAKSQGRTEDLTALCQDPAVVKFIQEDMNAVGKANQLKGFEFPSKVSLVAEPFSMENDILTPTFKIKRPQAKAHFQPLIDKMYEGAD